MTPFVPEGIPTDHVAVRAWQIESGLGTHLSRPSEGTVHELVDLPAGFYALELVGPGIGVVPIGQHWVDGHSVCDLGLVPVPAPGHVHFEVAPDDLAAGDQQHFEVYQLRPDVDLIMRLLQPRDAEHLLPAGDYAIAWRHRDLHLRFERFTVETGKAQTVRLQR